MIGNGWKPANGFEPMTFALQKRCSTTELSRQLFHRKHPQGQFQTVVATGFEQRSADVALNGAMTHNKPRRDGPVAQSLQQKGDDTMLGGGEPSVSGHSILVSAGRIPPGAS